MCIWPMSQILSESFSSPLLFLTITNDWTGRLEIKSYLLLTITTFIRQYTARQSSVYIIYFSIIYKLLH